MRQNNEGIKTIEDVAVGKRDLILSLRDGEELRLRGEVICDRKGRKHFIARCSPKRSFASGTKVVRFMG